MPPIYTEPKAPVSNEDQAPVDEAKLEAMQIREQHERDQKVEIAAKTLDGTPT